VQSLTPLYIPGHEKRDVKSDTNLEGRYDDGKRAEKQEYEQPVKRDVMDDINPEGEHDEEKTVVKKKQAEVMKQAEVPNNQEGIKKERNSGPDISKDPGTM
jgi:hypothetical protein